MRASGAIERLHRLRRRLGFDRNELRRGVDRLQWSAGLLLTVLFVVLGSTVAVLAAGPVYQDGVRAERQERAVRHQVVATALSRPEAGGPDAVARYVVRVRWTEPDGSARTRTAAAWSPQIRPGETRRVWVDDSGRPADPPRSHRRTVFETAATAAGAVLASGLLLLIAYMLVRQHTDRLRAAEWDAALARLNPRRTR